MCGLSNCIWNLVIVNIFFLLFCSILESPFEFRALEVALEAICSFLDARTTELETAAYPALDELTSKVSLSLFICWCVFPLYWASLQITKTNCQLARNVHICRYYILFANC